MDKQNDWEVFRNGWHASNQPSYSHPESTCVWRGLADSANHATTLALKSGVSVFHNQRLTAKPSGDADTVAAAQKNVRGIIRDFGTPEAARIGTQRIGDADSAWKFEATDIVTKIELVLQDKWETAAVEGRTLKLFRHDGAILEFCTIEKLDV